MVHEHHPDVIENRHRPLELFDVPYVKGVQAMRSYNKVGRIVSSEQVVEHSFQGYRQPNFRLRNKAKHGFESKSQVSLSRVSLCVSVCLY